MTVKTLNPAAKSILKELLKADDLRSVPRDRYDRPIKSMANREAAVGSAVYSFNKARDNNHMDWIRRENLSDRFKKFVADKQTCDNIVDPESKDFNEALYMQDMEAHSTELANEQEFLKYAKENPGMYSFNDVTHHVRVFNSLRDNFPSKLDAKYLKDKIITLTHTGTECLARFEELQESRKEIFARHAAQQLSKWHAERDLTMSEEDFQLLKTLKRLGQLDIQKVPVNEIQSWSGWTTARNYLEDALWNFDSVDAYNRDESKFIFDDKDAVKEFETTAFIENDGFKMNALVAMINEFMNLERIQNALAAVSCETTGSMAEVENA